eukprot:3551579-Prymnesium_polylepis.1
MESGWSSSESSTELSLRTSGAVGGGLTATGSGAAFGIGRASAVGAGAAAVVAALRAEAEEARSIVLLGAGGDGAVGGGPSSHEKSSSHMACHLLSPST